MSFELFFFPPDSRLATLVARHDTGGWILVAEPDMHWSGRIGQSFKIPNATPNGNGMELQVDQPGYDHESQRGILLLNDGVLPWPFDAKQEAAFAVDDIRLNVTKVCPPCPPPCPNVPPPAGGDPLTIINSVYKTGQFDLSTHDGCGKFTEACVTALHTLDSANWGHIKKSGAQNQYNGHAVDAIMLLTPTLATKAGIYDIVFDSASPNAHPQFNFSGPPVPSLWYYPA